MWNPWSKCTGTLKPWHCPESPWPAQKLTIKDLFLSTDADDLRLDKNQACLSALFADPVRERGLAFLLCRTRNAEKNRAKRQSSIRVQAHSNGADSQGDPRVLTCLAFARESTPNTHSTQYGED